MEDLNLYLKDVLTEHPHTRVPSADTVLRGIEELATENILLLTAVVWATHWVHVPILRIKKLLRILGYYY